MRWIIGGEAAQGLAASPSQMGRFETRWLTAERNLCALADLSGRWIDLVHGRRPPRGIVLDMDSSVSPTHGEQEMSVWNGHYACTCYHPLFVFNQFGDLERCALRPGNVHSADGWEHVLKPVIVRYQGKVLRIYFRADAAFAMQGDRGVEHFQIEGPTYRNVQVRHIAGVSRARHHPVVGVGRIEMTACRIEAGRLALAHGMDMNAMILPTRYAHETLDHCSIDLQRLRRLRGRGR